ncbi:MAG TPA: HDOD domain-containing protein [Sideroxyarcus sp.]|nr:HDOD domain-containing protein [Sideroxyarcus sp.]
MNAALHQALDQLGALPPIPNIAQRILSLRIGDDDSERTLLGLIEQDPPLLAKVIGLANSPLFGTSRKIMSLHDAVAILGHRRVQMVALSFAMMASMSRKSSGRLDIHGLWQHSLSVAMAMDTLAREMPPALRPSDEALYLAGLLHDIGFLVLDHLDPELSDRFHARLAHDPAQPIEVVEAEMLETSHGELGAALARHWGLPEPTPTVLRYHHDPDNAQAVAGRPLAAMINMAEQLLPTFGIAEPVQQHIPPEAWQSLGIDPARAEHVRTRVVQQARA